MDTKEKMLELIKKKQGGGRSKKMAEPKKDVGEFHQHQKV